MLLSRAFLCMTNAAGPRRAGRSTVLDGRLAGWVALIPGRIAPTAVLLASDTFYVGQPLSPNGGDVVL